MDQKQLSFRQRRRKAQVEKWWLPVGKILQALAKYRTLVSSQLATIGVGAKRVDHIEDLLLWMHEMEPCWVWRATYDVPSNSEDRKKRGRVEYLYSLAPEGKAVLIEEYGLPAERIRCPKRPTKPKDKYFHRRYIRDCVISFDTFIKRKEGSISLVIFDDDMTGNNRRDGNSQSMATIILKQEPKLAITADFILKWRLSCHKTMLFVCEMHCRDRDIQVMSKKNYRHLRGLVTKITHETFNYSIEDKLYIMNVFERAKDMKKLQNTSGGRHKFDDTYEFFLFNTLENVQEEFTKGWTNFRWESVDIVALMSQEEMVEGEQYREDDW